MLPFQQRELSVVAMAKLSPARSVHRPVRFHKHRTHQRTWLPVGAWLINGMLHHLDGLSIILRASSFRSEGMEVLVTMGLARFYRSNFPYGHAQFAM